MARTYAHILFYALLALSTGCSVEPEATKQEDPNVEKVSWESVRLPLVLSVSPSVKERMSERWNPAFGRLEIEIAPHLEVFVVQTRYSVSSKLQDPSLAIFELEFYEKTDSLLIFGSRIPDSDAIYWQFFRTFEVDGQPYYAENNPLIAYNREDVRTMSQIFADIRPANSSLAENQ